MSKRANLVFCPLEYEYQAAYGIMPDYDIDRHIEQGMTWQEANDLVNNNLNDLWEKMKYEHEHREQIEYAKMLAELDRECPF